MLVFVEAVNDCRIVCNYGDAFGINQVDFNVHGRKSSLVDDGFDTKGKDVFTLTLAYFAGQ